MFPVLCDHNKLTYDFQEGFILFLGFLELLVFINYK